MNVSSISPPRLNTQLDACTIRLIKNGDSVEDAGKHVLNRRVSVLMEIDDESTIMPLQKPSGKSDRKGDIDDGCLTATQWDESAKHVCNAKTPQQSVDIIKEVETAIQERVLLRKAHSFAKKTDGNRRGSESDNVGKELHNF